MKMLRQNRKGCTLERANSWFVPMVMLFLSLFSYGQGVNAAPVENDTQSPTFVELQRRVSEAHFEAAYSMAQAMESSQGDPHFDFLYGLAAVSSGHPAEAVLALERHLSSVPGNDRARLELARAYFELGEYVRARQEFEFVLKYNPPAEVRGNIARYLDSMQTRESLSRQNSARWYVEAGFGQDSNVNAGTYNSMLDLPGGSVTLVDAGSKAAASMYTSLAAGARWTHQVNAPLSVFGGVDIDNRSNTDASQYDSSNFGAYAGFSLISNGLLYRLSVADSMMAINNSRYRTSLSTTGEVQDAIGDGLSVYGLMQYAEQSYGGENAIRDSTLETVATGVQQTLNVFGQPLIGLHLSYAREDNLNHRPDLGQEIGSYRLTANFTPVPGWGVSLGYSDQSGNYQGVDIAFGSARQDRLIAYDLGVRYSIDAHWQLRCEYQSSENTSNQSLYAYRREYGGIKLRYGY